MRRFKIALSILFVGAAMTAGSYGKPALGAESSNSIPNLEIDVDSCNVSVVKSNEAVLTYTCDDSKFFVNKQSEGNTITLKAKLKEGASAELSDQVIIRIPDLEYGKITVQNENGGVSLPELNSDFQVSSKGGSVSFRVQPGYSKTFSCWLENSAGTINFLSGSGNYELHIYARDSAVTAPVGFPAIGSAPAVYNYRNGSGTAQFNIGLQNCAFSIACEP